METQRILIADDEPSHRFILTEALRREGFEVRTAQDGEEAIRIMTDFAPHLMVLDIRMPGKDGMEVLAEARRLQPDALVIMNTAFGTSERALEAIRHGAYDYFTKPVELDEFRIVVRRALETQFLRRQVSSLQTRLDQRLSFDRLIGPSDAMQSVFSLLRRISQSDLTVLITGESGTGKELVAQAIHQNSPRKGQPFVSVNCAAIPEPLLESELFGHERGSFTGAIATKRGQFELADGGTIFLDEIGEMPISLQPKILRVLQEREIMRVGATKPMKVNIRVLAATNRDLQTEVVARRFREDLYFRLKVMPVEIPPLRNRTPDIPPLVKHFIAFYNPRLGRNILGVSDLAVRVLAHYHWPGNVRELENTIQRAMVLSESTILELSDLPEEVTRPAYEAGLISKLQKEMSKKKAPLLPMTGHEFSKEGPWSQEFLGNMTIPLPDKVEAATDYVESQVIQLALESCQQHRQATADLLGISRKSLHNKMTKLGLFTDRPDTQDQEITT
jgi:DNA-binding NtrC family response regulator